MPNVQPAAILILATLLGCAPPPGVTSDDAATTDDTGTKPADTGTKPVDTGVPGPFAPFADADLTDPDAVRGMANGVSAAKVYEAMFALAVFVPTDTTSPCPTLVEDKVAGTAEATGGCTDGDGAEWIGTVKTTSIPKSSYTIEALGWGFSSLVPCDSGAATSESVEYTGVAVFPDGETGPFSAELGITVTTADPVSCTTSTATTSYVSYSGTLNPPPKGANYLFSGSGRYGNDVFGKAEGSTTAELIDDSVCGTEAMSGNTTITSVANTVVVTYDGSTDCDPTSTVTWTLDGTAQGELDGVTCNTAAGGGGALAVGVFSLLLAVRRRRE